MSAAIGTIYTFTTEDELIAFVPDSPVPGSIANVIETGDSYAMMADDSGDIAVAGFGGLYWTIQESDIPAGSVTDAMLATMPTHTFKANITAGTASPTNVTRTELTAELNAATTLLQGAMAATDKVKLDGITTGTYAALISASDTLAVAGLNGDSDGDYFIDGEIFINASSNLIQFYVNGAASNLIGSQTDITRGAASDSAGPSTQWTIGANGLSGGQSFVSGQKVYVQGRLRAKSGRVRYVVLDILATGSTNDFGTGYSRDSFTTRGVWTDTSTNLTSIGIHSSQATGLGIGSWLRAVPDKVTL